jgi:hypothetical protein
MKLDHQGVCCSPRLTHPLLILGNLKPMVSSRPLSGGLPGGNAPKLCCTLLYANVVPCTLLHTIVSSCTIRCPVCTIVPNTLLMMVASVSQSVHACHVPVHPIHGCVYSLMVGPQGRCSTISEPLMCSLKERAHDPRTAN